MEMSLKYNNDAHTNEILNKMREKIRLSNKMITDVVTELVGEDAIKIVEFIKDKKNISEFKIAEAIKLDMQELRNILYRLHNYNLVSYYRKKDRQKGWYISYFTFNKQIVKDLYIKTIKEKLEKYKKRLEQEYRSEYYICPNLCARLDFDQALEMQYKCPECGNLLQQQDNQKTIILLKEKIKEIESKV